MYRSLYGGRVFAAVLTAGLVLAGCGDSNSNSTSTAALTKAEFLKRGNAICAKGTRENDKVAKRVFPKHTKPTAAQLKQFTAAVASTVQGEINDIRALGAPAGDSAKVDAFTSAAQSALNKAKQDPTAFLKGNPFKQADQLARAYGLTACAGGGGGNG